MSPWVATTRLSRVATITLQPVPQNRHGALSHLSSLAARSVVRFAAASGVDRPPAAAAIAAASSLRKARRSTALVVMVPSPDRRPGRRRRRLWRERPDLRKEHQAAVRWR